MRPGLLLTALSLGLAAQGEFVSEVPEASDYDYIIVGSGAGGSPMAARLARYGHRVMLVDAGDDQTNTEEYTNPVLNLKASEHPPMAWNFFVNHYADGARQQRDSKMTWTTPSGELYVGTWPPQGSRPKGILYPRTGTFGGCTTHNAMFSIYPHEEDWNYIARITGDASWEARNMRPLFNRLERKRYLAKKPRGHGYDGWLTTTAFPMNTTLGDAKMGAMVASGFGATAMDKGVVEQLAQRDLNEDSPVHDQCYSYFQMTISVTEKKKRSGPIDAVKACLADERSGRLAGRLDILLTTLVTRVLFDDGAGGKPTARGVEYVRGRSLYRADPRAPGGGALPARRRIFVRREVILAGGAFNTPQMLKLSGVGPRRELERWGIPVVADLPGVGTNLQDRYENTVVAGTADKFKERFSVVYLKKSSVAENDTPDLFITGSVVNFTGYYPGYSKVATGNPLMWSWIVLKAHTRNRAGTVELRSHDPRDVPLINFNYFDTGTNAHGEADLDARAMTEGVEWARAVSRDANRAGVARFNEAWPGPGLPSAGVTDYVKREAWGHHASCTCPIGADDDPMAVLDSGFRVRCVDGLRVVDASVFPRIPGFFIVVPVYMISEKAADRIHQDSRSYARPQPRPYPRPYQRPFPRPFPFPPPGPLPPFSEYPVSSSPPHGHPVSCPPPYNHPVSSYPPPSPSSAYNPYR